MEPKNNIFEQNRKKGKEVSLQKNCNPWFLSIFLSTSTFTLWQQKSEAAALCRNSIHEEIESGWLQSFLLAAATLSRLAPSCLALTTLNILSNYFNLNYWQYKPYRTYFLFFYQTRFRMFFGHRNQSRYCWVGRANATYELWHPPKSSIIKLYHWK